jgi:localization factor PodJL
MADVDRPSEPVAPEAPSRVGGSAGESVRDLSELYRRFSAYLEQESQGLRQGISGSVAWDGAVADALAGLHEEFGPSQGHGGGARPGAGAAAGGSGPASSGDMDCRLAGLMPRELMPIEQRIDRLAARLEQAVSTALSGNATAALGARLAAFEQRLGAALERLASRTDVEGLKLVEAHALEVSQHMGAALHRLESIEAQVAYLIGRPCHMEAARPWEQERAPAIDSAGLAEAIAQHLAHRLADSAAAATMEIRRLLEFRLGRQQAEEQQRAAALDRVRSELLRLAERLGAVEREIGSPDPGLRVPDAHRRGDAHDGAPSPARGIGDPFLPDAGALPRGCERTERTALDLSGPDRNPWLGSEPRPAARPQGPPPLPTEGLEGEFRAHREPPAEAAATAAQPAIQRREPLARARRNAHSSAFLTVLAVLAALGAGLTAFGVLWSGASSAPLAARAAGADRADRVPEMLGASQGTGSVALAENFSAAPGAAGPPATADARVTGPAGPHPVITGGASPLKVFAAAGGTSDNGKDGHLGLAHPLAPAMTGSLSLRVAAAGGDPSAQFAIALSFARIGLQQDLAQGFLWCQRAALKGFVPAQYRLAGLYERGLGVASDLVRAREWYRRAAEGGHVKAMHNLAVFATRGRGGLIDYAEAARWFGEAAERGLRDSQFNLALFYENGLGVPQDAVQAYKWFALAARQEDRDAERRRDQVAEGLAPHRLADARALVKGWTPTPVEPQINDTRLAAEAWRNRWPETG